MSLCLPRRRSCWLQLAGATLMATFCVYVLWSSSIEYRRTKQLLMRQLAARSPPPPSSSLPPAGMPCAGGSASFAPAATWVAVASPQLGDAGPYRVVYDFAVADERPTGNQSVTLCTHATADTAAERAATLADAWAGPVSLAVFVLPEEVCSLSVWLAHFRRCRASFRQHVSVHLVYHRQRAPELALLSAVDKLSGDCARPPPPPAPSTRRQRGLPYPVNVARNAARRAARTHYVLSSDSELVPSPGVAPLFLQLMARVGRGEQPRLAVSHRQVYVLPVFEVEHRLPHNKTDLLQMLRDGEAVWFHRHVCPHCQKFPGLLQYALRPFSPGKVQVLTISRREVPFHRWEPIYIGTDAEPLYDERLSWEGKQDKMTQMTELCLLRYRLVVLDQLFLTHVPQPGGIRRQPGFTDPADGWRAPFIRQNQKTYERIVHTLRGRYPGDNRKCVAR